MYFPSFQTVHAAHAFKYSGIWASAEPKPENFERKEFVTTFFRQDLVSVVSCAKIKIWMPCFPRNWICGSFPYNDAITFLHRYFFLKSFVFRFIKRITHPPLWRSRGPPTRPSQRNKCGAKHQSPPSDPLANNLSTGQRKAWPTGGSANFNLGRAAHVQQRSDRMRIDWGLMATDLLDRSS